MKGRSTQSLVNTYPGWADTRTDEQSAGFQLMNVIGRRFDDLRKQSARGFDNMFLGNSIVSDIDVYYAFKLPGSFEFHKYDDDDTEFIFTPPTVSGILNDTQYAVDIADNNDIETFWYNLDPDRLTLEETFSGEHLIAEGPVIESPFTPTHPSGELHLTGHVHVELTSGISYVGLNDQQIVRRGLVQVTGTTREGRDVTEELHFVHDDILRTRNEFQTIAENGIRVYGVEPSGTMMRAYSARFGLSDYPINYQLDEVVTGQEMPLFWSVSTNEETEFSTLELMKYELDEVELRLAGFVGKQTALRQDFVDTEGSGIVITDIAPEPHSDALWAVSEHNLYRFSSDLPYGDLTQLTGKDYQAASVIMPNSYYVLKGEEVQLDYVWRKPTTGFVKHRAWVVKPDGTKKSLELGAEETYRTNETSWVFGEPVRRQIRPTEFYTLDQYGTYVYCLEVTYADDTTSIDKRVVTVVAKQATSEFYLPTIGVVGDITGIDFDSEYNMWLSDSSNNKYRVERHYDKMLVDFDKKVIYFRELYDKVRVL